MTTSTRSEVGRSVVSVDGVDVLDLKPNQPARNLSVVAVAAYKTVVQNIPFNEPTAAVFQATEYDFGGGWNGATGRFTAPLAGIYMVTGVFATGVLSVANQNIAVEIYKNGTLARKGYQRVENGTSPGGHVTSIVSAQLHLNVGDYIQLTLFQTAGTVAAEAGSYGTTFQVTLLERTA